MACVSCRWACRWLVKIAWHFARGAVVSVSAFWTLLAKEIHSRDLLVEWVQKLVGKAK